MSWLRSDRKLPPPKKAWKSFISMIKSKLHHLRKSKAFQKTTHRSVAIRSIHHPLFSLERHKNHENHHHHYHHHHHHHQGQEAQMGLDDIVFVDTLFEEHGMVHAKHVHRQVETSETIERVAPNIVPSRAKVGGKARVRAMIMEEEHTPTIETMVHDQNEENTSGPVGTSKASASTSPELHGVDAKAEDFINRFHHHLKLQKAKSIEDFHDMLDRST
ncbi:hypothetical protein L1049_000115 [Liquidambar formosana]|uniref:Uncharacterized protein n=1 Tax=Liquidambar formosana TaxID=63359 RepID=A0AAP0R7H0_LIQFO